MNIHSLIRDSKAARECALARQIRDELSPEQYIAEAGQFLTSGGKRRSPRDQACLDAALAYIANQYQIITVRQLFYQASSVHALVPKNENGYKLVCRRSAALRRGHLLPFQRFSDSTRWMRKPESWDSAEAMLDTIADTFRLNLWKGHDRRCEIWCEKDALAGVIAPITERYDVPLMVSRGMSSITFLHQAAQEIRHASRIGIDTTIFLAYDFDASGQIAAREIRQGLKEMSGVDIEVETLAVTAAQVSEMNLPTRDPKPADFQKGWDYDFCCELDAINPDQLQAMVTEAIESVADLQLMEDLRLEERLAKEGLKNFPGFSA